MLDKIEIGDIVKTPYRDDYRIFYRINENTLMSFIYSDTFKELDIDKEEYDAKKLYDPKSVLSHCTKGSKKELLVHLISRGTQHRANS